MPILGLEPGIQKGGMKTVVDSFVELAKELGVVFYLDSPVSKINVENNEATSMEINGNTIDIETLLSGADYAHTETLLSPVYRNLHRELLESKTMAPSSLLFYVGFSKKLKNVLHHTLFFDGSFEGTCC